MFWRFLFVFIFICQTAISADDSLKHPKFKVLPVPAFGYSPETRAYIGVVSLLTFHLYDSATRTSNAKLELNYTWNKQLITEGEWNYFFNHESWFTKGRVHFSKYPDFYYGLGNDTPDSNKLVFNSSRIIIDLFGLKQIRPQLFAGLNFRYLEYSHIKNNADEFRYPELTSNNTYGIGYGLLLDRRNSILSPSAGSFIFLNGSYNFSAINYCKLAFDIRQYQSWRKDYTIALRLFSELSIGIPPFFEMGMLGGDKYVRGYYYGRYRDKNLTTLQGEFRLPVAWRFGLATFAGLSSVYPDFNSFNLSQFKYNYGMGIRFMIDRKERTNLRLDYALGQRGNNGFYISFGESF